MRRPDGERIGLESRAAPDVEMDEEINAHRQLHVDDLVRSGVPLEEARRVSDARFEKLAATRQQLHDAARRRGDQLRHRDSWDSLRGDLHFAMRQIRRHRAHFALAVFTVALGIGMTTAIFTLLERVVFKPLPFNRPEQLVVTRGLDTLHEAVRVVSNDDWLDWKDGATVFASMALLDEPYRGTIRTADSATRVTQVDVSADFFRTIETRFIAGRPFSPDEVIAQNAIVVSERFWRQYLGADATLSRRLSPLGVQVVGVIADGAAYPSDVDVWRPMPVVRYGGGGTRNNINSIAIARLKPGYTVAQASADLTRVSQGIRAHDRGGLYDFGADVITLQADIVGDTRESLRLLGGGVLLVLLIVCANLAITTLGRGSSRAAEMAIRASLGARRRRLIAQLLVEQLVLAVLGGIGGIALAWVAVRVILATWGNQIPRANEIHLDAVVLGFAFLMSLVVAMVTGMVPAVRWSRVSLQAVMKQGGRQATQRKQYGPVMLVMLEFALAVTLVAGAGLLLRSFGQLVGRDLGFSRNVATAEISMTSARYRGDSALRLSTWDRLIAAYRAIPGVSHVGAANATPLAVGGSGFIAIDGDPATRGGAGYRMVSEDYFDALGLRLLQGRVFNTQDAAGAPRTVVINASLAKQSWPGQNPVGHQIRAVSMETSPKGELPGWLTVIGVVNDLRQHGYAQDPAPEMYVSIRQAPQWRTAALTAVIGANIPVKRLLPAIRAKTREVDPQLGVDIETMDGRLSGLMAPRALTMSLLSGFAALALLLAALGIYAVLSYLVAQRTREIALRTALGAQRSSVLALVVWYGMRTAGLGVVAGVLGAAALSKVLSSMLVDIRGLDPIVFGSAVLLLLVVALVAALVPALRAARLDPMIALKSM